jgi:Uma2 family endonuclease
MEVVSNSPEDRRRDLVTKRREYAQAGIPEYWIVDPQSQTVTVLGLDGRGYVEGGLYGQGETAQSVLLPEFAVAVNEIFNIA